MKCPLCGAENNDSVRYCGKCWQEIPRCPTCYQVLTKPTAVCEHDGTRIPASVLALFPNAAPAAEQIRISESDIPAAEQIRIPESDIPAAEQIRIPESNIPAAEQIRIPESNIPAAEQIRIPESDIPAAEQIRIAENSTPRKDQPRRTEEKKPLRQNEPTGKRRPRTPESVVVASGVSRQGSRHQVMEVVQDAHSEGIIITDLSDSQNRHLGAENYQSPSHQSRPGSPRTTPRNDRPRPRPSDTGRKSPPARDSSSQKKNDRFLGKLIGFLIALMILLISMLLCMHACGVFGPGKNISSDHESNPPIVTTEPTVPSTAPEVIEYVTTYKIIPGNMSWTDAKRICEEQGGTLASITSQEEYDQICALASQTNLHYLWIGASLESPEQSWSDCTWVNGDAWSFENWYPDEPSGVDDDGTWEGYLCLWHVKHDGRDIGWTFNDQRNDLVSSFSYTRGKVGCVCEFVTEVSR